VFIAGFVGYRMRGDGIKGEPDQFRLGSILGARGIHRTITYSKANHAHFAIQAVQPQLRQFLIGAAVGVLCHPLGNAFRLLVAGRGLDARLDALEMPAPRRGQGFDVQKQLVCNGHGGPQKGIESSKSGAADPLCCTVCAVSLATRSLMASCSQPGSLANTSSLWLSMS